ncbi:MAG: helix-turn-helix transcriptional regulator [Bifidobacteriaceae bacterium]|jgi:DNA-binding HxlR family transcriptional regulator|nr:helix-turn-helix transcriptional regulator [Bifidobacteriaceae bacterium]
MSVSVCEEREARGNVYLATCPCRDLLDVVSGKWSALVIGALAGGPLRFGVLQGRVGGVSAKVLTATLRRLEGFALVDRVVYAAVPARVEYSLTAAGLAAVEPLAALCGWAEDHLRLVSAA